MYELTREEDGKAVPFEWTTTRQKAFEAIKVKLATAPVVAHPNFDKPFILYMDASGGGVGAVLHQKGDDRRERIIACVSRTYNEHEKKYLITEQECLGCKKVQAVSQYKVFQDYN